MAFHKSMAGAKIMTVDNLFINNGINWSGRRKQDHAGGVPEF